MHSQYDAKKLDFFSRDVLPLLLVFLEETVKGVLFHLIRRYKNFQAHQHIRQFTLCSLVDAERYNLLSVMFNMKL